MNIENAPRVLSDELGLHDQHVPREEHQIWPQFHEFLPDCALYFGYRFERGAVKAIRGNPKLGAKA